MNLSKTECKTEMRKSPVQYMTDYYLKLTQQTTGLSYLYIYVFEMEIIDSLHLVVCAVQSRTIRYRHQWLLAWRITDVRFGDVLTTAIVESMILSH